MSDEQTERSACLAERCSFGKSQMKATDTDVRAILEETEARLRAFSMDSARDVGVFRGGAAAEAVSARFGRLLLLIEDRVRQMDALSLQYSALESEGQELQWARLQAEADGDDTSAMTSLREEIALWQKGLELRRAAMQAFCREDVARFLEKSAEAADLVGGGAACSPGQLSTLCGALAQRCALLKMRFL